MSKLDIDVLVSVMLYGPAGAGDEWRPLDRTEGLPPEKLPAIGTRLGRMLWRMNADNVLDPEEDEPLPEYVFERPPCELTAVEGLKAVHCYVYQSADDQERWNGSEAQGVCYWLERALTRYVPGYDDAPWGWSARDVDARLDQARAAAHVSRPPSPGAAAGVLEAFETNGIRLVSRSRTDTYPAHPEWTPQTPHHKIAHWVSSGFQDREQVQVRLFADDDGAHSLFLARRAWYEHQDGGIGRAEQLLARFGPVLVEIVRMHRDHLHPVTHVWQPEIQDAQDRALALLGDADEAWSSQDRPMLGEIGRGTVLARRVSLPLGYGTDGVFAGTDRAGVERIADLVEDEDARARIRAVDTDRQTVLMLCGIADAQDVNRAGTYEIAAPPGADPRYLLEVSVDGVRYAPAVVIAVDKVPVRPTEVHLYRADGGSPNQYPVYSS